MCARLAFQTDTAFPFSGQDSSHPLLLSLLVKSENPFQSLCACMLVYVDSILSTSRDIRALSLTLSQVAGSLSKEALGRKCFGQ